MSSIDMTRLSVSSDHAGVPPIHPKGPPSKKFEDEWFDLHYQYESGMLTAGTMMATQDHLMRSAASYYRWRPLNWFGKELLDLLTTVGFVALLAYAINKAFPGIDIGLVRMLFLYLLVRIFLIGLPTKERYREIEKERARRRDMPWLDRYKEDWDHQTTRVLALGALSAIFWVIPL